MHYAVAPGKLIISQIKTANFGDNVTLTCSARGGPQNVFQWQTNGTDLPGENQTTLQLTDIDATDGGEYTCVVSNGAGNDSISTTLYIRPYFTTQPMSISTKAGQNETLTCEAEGFPEPTIQWFRDNGADFGLNVTGMVTSNLMFTPVQFGDEGDYYCTAASNGESSNTTTVTLTGIHITLVMNGSSVGKFFSTISYSVDNAMFH